MTTVSSGQTLVIAAGQASSGIIVLSGGFLDVLSGGTVVDTIDSGSMDVESGGIGSNTLIDGGSESVLSGGTQISATVSAGGALTVSSGGIVDDLTVSSGGTLFDFGAASGTTVNSGGMEVVASGGGVARNTTVHSGGILDVLSGGTVISTVDSGIMNVESGGTGIGIVVLSGNGNSLPPYHRRRRIVVRQRERVEMLARNGCDTTQAKRTLDLFARTLNIFEDDLRKILGDERKRASGRRG